MSLLVTFPHPRARTQRRPSPQPPMGPYHLCARTQRPTPTRCPCRGFVAPCRPTRLTPPLESRSTVCALVI